MARMKQPPKAHGGKAKKANPLLENISEDQGDELDSTPQEVSRRRDPDYQLHKRAMESNRRYQSTMANIFEKYGRDFGNVADEIDLRTGEIVINRGHIEHMRDEGDVGADDSEDESDEEDDAEFSPAGTPPDVSEDDEDAEDNEDIQESVIKAKAREYTKALSKAEELNGWLVDGDEEEVQDGWEDMSGDDEEFSEEEVEENEDEGKKKDEEVQEEEGEEDISESSARQGDKHNQIQQAAPALPAQSTNPALQTQPFPYMPFPFFPMAHQMAAPQSFPPMPPLGPLPFTHGTDVEQIPPGLEGQSLISFNPYAYYMSQWAQASQQGFPGFHQKVKPRKKVLRDKLTERSKPKERSSFTSIWTQDPPQRKPRAKKATKAQEQSIGKDEKTTGYKGHKITASSKNPPEDITLPTVKRRGRKPGSKNKRPGKQGGPFNIQGGQTDSGGQVESSVREDRGHSQTSHAEGNPPFPVSNMRQDDAQEEDDANRRRSGRQRKQTDFLGMTSWYKANKTRVVVEIRGSSPSSRLGYEPVDLPQERETNSPEYQTAKEEALGATKPITIPDSQELSTPPVSSADQESTPNNRLQLPSYHYSRPDHGAALSDDSRPVSPAVTRLSKSRGRPEEEASLAIRVADALSSKALISEERQPSPGVGGTQENVSEDGITPELDCGKNLVQFEDNAALPDSGIDVSHEELDLQNEIEPLSNDEAAQKSTQPKLTANHYQTGESINEDPAIIEDVEPEIDIAAADLPVVEEQQSNSQEPQETQATIQNSTDETSSPAPIQDIHKKKKRGRPPKPKPEPKPLASPKSPTPTKSTSISPKKPTPPRDQLPTSSPNRNHSDSVTHTPTKTATPSTPHRTKAHLREPSSRRSLLSLLSDDEADDLSRDIPSKMFSPTCRILDTLKVTSTARRASSPMASRRVWKKRSAVGLSELLHTPTKKRRRGVGEAGSPTLVETPGGSKKRCGVDGFICGRDFCFSCVV